MSSTLHARSAAAYEQFMGRWSRKLSKPFIHFSAIGNGTSVLDVGCGTGSLAFSLSENLSLKWIVGVDMSEVYLDAARSNNHDERITFQNSDVTELPFETGSFDASLSMLVLQFVPETDRAISEMRRVVRSHGTVAAAVWDSYGGMPAHRMFWDAAYALGFGADKDLREFYFRPMTGANELRD